MLMDHKREIFGITVDNSGNIFFTTRTHHLWKCSVDGTNVKCLLELQPFKDKQPSLGGIVWEETENALYACDMIGCRILKYYIDTNSMSTFAGTGITGPRDGTIEDAQFTRPIGITIHKGCLFISEIFSVRKINLQTGTVQTIAGCNVPGHKNGDAKTAQFQVAQYLVVGDDDTVYVSDLWNHAIRKIKDGIVSTIAEEFFDDTVFSDSLACYSPVTFPWGIILCKDGSLLVAGKTLRRVNELQNSIESEADIVCGGIVRDNDGNLYLGGQGCIWKLIDPWYYERYLWIGVLKESATCCPLASLPKDIVVQIALHLRRTE